eukprot:GHVS01081835.1.p1 GENE.GHVS01081835.1~~GHVS01081835.1.p1  ORF type:complete len:235 (-),score=64.44 GHVS01081835.1:1212-1916(-)
MSSVSGATTAATSSTPGTPPTAVVPLCGKLVVGLLGCGTVGGGVVELLREFSQSIRIKKICVADLKKKREGVTVPVGCEVVSGDVMSVVEDAEINCIVEVMGGTGIAKDAMLKALKLGKHVVTANKAAIAGGLDEFDRVVQEQKHKTAFMYEAAVCGGIPIISVVRRALSCDQITKVVGIMNGTTNYMLTRMEKEGVPYQAVKKTRRRMKEQSTSCSVDQQQQQDGRGKPEMFV